MKKCNPCQQTIAFLETSVARDERKHLAATQITLPPNCVSLTPLKPVEHLDIWPILLIIKKVGDRH